jgi:TonB family protein
MAVPFAFALYSLQIALLVSIAAAAAAALRVSTPGMRLQYWRAVGAAVLMLPFVPLPADAPQVSAVVFGDAASAAGSLAPSSLPTSVAAPLMWIWAAGVLLFMTSLLVGALRLRRIRARSTPVSGRHDLDALRRALAPHAALRWTDDVRQPVTFGLRSPVVLLPAPFGALGAEAQRAVVAHELIHVARRDWAWIVLEAHVRALFWFHPAMWWLLDQVHLSREQVVDRLVVQRTGSRKTYMQALMAFADAGGAASPAIAFLGRRHLKSRLQQLSREGHMSSLRRVCTAAALAVALAGATTAIASALPIELPVMRQVSAAPRLEIRLAETAPAPGLTEFRMAGAGEPIYLYPAVLVTGADVTSASTTGSGVAFSVAVTFSDAASSRLTTATRQHIGRPVAILLDDRVVAAPVVRAPIGRSAVISGPFTEEEANALAAGLARRPAVRTPGAGQPAPTVAASRDPGVELPVVISDVKPYYTPAALQAGITGDVGLQAVVLADGTVGDVRVTSPLDADLDEQAVAAMKQWRFYPGTKDGVAVAVSVEVLMRFTLK